MSTTWEDAVSGIVTDLCEAEQQRRQVEARARQVQQRMDECRRYGVDPSAVARRLQAGAEFGEALAAEARAAAFEEGRREGQRRAELEAAGFIENDERRMRVVPQAAKVPTRHELMSSALQDPEVRHALDGMKADWHRETPDDAPRLLGP